MREKMIQLKSKILSVPRKKLLIFGGLVLLVLLMVVGMIAYGVYQRIYAANVSLKSSDKQYLFISKNDDFEHIKVKLYADNIILDKAGFEWVAQMMDYKKTIKPGRYLLKNGMSNRDLFNLLRSGKQESVKLIFNNIRLKEDFAARISEQIDLSGADLLLALNDPQKAQSYGFNTENFLCMFVPNTYYIYWNTDVHEFLNRMKAEYDKFWTEEKQQKAQARGMSLIQVSILASIVEKETQQNPEKPRMAGVYINRLKNDWPLQADPTLVFASGDFTIKRVLNKHKEIDSPYNTYKNPGLPPGPICIPSIASLNAVLDSENHNYFYFCAKPDYSGLHNFASTNAQHNRYANEYRQFLNHEKILK
jgi:UPF0755 protein